MTTDAKVQIGLSTDYLEGTSVNTPAGTNLFREGVVISDPDNANGRANIKQLGTQLTTSDKGLITNTIIHGLTTGGGGGYVDVKANPSGALVVDSSGSVVALDAPTLAALENINATVSGTVAVSNLPATQTVSGTVALDSSSLAALESINVQNTVSTTDSTDTEYLRIATSVNAIGDTTLVTPAAGKRIRLQWVYAINDPVATTSTKITIKLGSSVQYVAWAISKRQQLTGPVDGPLIVNLTNSGDVAVTVFYQEV